MILVFFRVLTFLAVYSVVLCMPGLVLAAVIPADPSNYRSLLAGLNPGDTLELAAGTYTAGLPMTDVSGTAAQPIIIRGPDDQSAVFQADDCCNTVQLQNVSFVEVRNLTLDGSGTNGAFGVDSRGACHDITIENLRIVNYGADQQNVGISTKGPAWNWAIRRNTIIGAGTGIYLGNSDGSAPFVNGLIEYNVILDTVGYNMQIKHQLPRPTGIGLPTGDSRTVIRHNVFSKQNNGSAGALARPNLLVGHFPLSGDGQNDLYEIYGNFFYANPVEALFQGEGNIALHDNLFVNASGDAVNIAAQNDRPRSVTVFHNTVVAAGSGIRISGADATFEQKIIGNAVFAGSPISGPNQQNNITGSLASATDFLNAPTAPIGTLDLYPKPGQLSGPAIDLGQFGGFTDAARDFNGTPRGGIYRGAYEGDGNNPGWLPRLAMKPGAGGPVAPAITLTADPAMVSIDGSSSLDWTASDANSCTASGGWSGPRAPSGSEVVGPLAQSTTFSLFCTGDGGSSSASVTVTVTQGSPAPSVTLTASPSSVAAGESSELAWQSTDTTDCVAEGGWSGRKALNGSEIVGPIQATTSFTLTCTGPGGSASDTAQVSVAPAPTLSFQTERASVSAGQSTMLSWTAADATTCTATGAWSGNKPLSGSESTGTLNSDSTFALTCSGAGGTVARELTVTVTASNPGPTPPGDEGRSGGGAISPFGLIGLLALACFGRIRGRPRPAATAD